MFRIIWSILKLRFHTNMKDQIPKLMKSYVVYQFNCPSCNDSYIGKTEYNLYTRTEEHACNDIKKVPFTTILTTAVIRALLRFNNLIKH